MLCWLTQPRTLRFYSYDSWIIGLSGAGKSTLSKQVIEEARGRGRTVVSWGIVYVIYSVMT